MKYNNTVLAALVIVIALSRRAESSTSKLQRSHRVRAVGRRHIIFERATVFPTHTGRSRQEDTGSLRRYQNAGSQ
jgi:hypothetical protein